jgi:Spy/CpxP family protein refolding chaperone
MFGFVFGTACLVALGFVVARGRHRHWGRRFGGPFGRHALYGVLERLETTPGQEKIITQAVSGFRETASRSRSAFESSRKAAARAVQGEVFDESALREAFLEQDAAIAEIREALVATGRRVHETLDERQRKILGELIESGPGFRRFGHHHHGFYGHRHAYC